MNPVAAPFLHLARVVIETRTPLSIAAGPTSDLLANLLVRDANGLPAIPGSSLAGVLRGLYREQHGPPAAAQAAGAAERGGPGTEAGDDQGERAGEPDPVDLLFGCARAGETGSRASALEVSWGCIHDSRDRPVQGLLDPDAPRLRDPLLRDALGLAPVRRQRVRINGRGVADMARRGLFQRVALTCGHRFTFELALWSARPQDPRWPRILGLLRLPRFRLGGATRQGLGRVRLCRCHQGVLDLRRPDHRARLALLGADLGRTEGLAPWPARSGDDGGRRAGGEEGGWRILLKLRPEPGGLRMGGGTRSLARDQDGRTARHLPLSERRILWNREDGAERGQVERDPALLLPGSAIKGPLRHRTAYHANLLQGTSLEADEHPAVRRLFGMVDEDRKESRPGLLMPDDLYLPARDGKGRENFTVRRVVHVAIDRFTGGARRHLLFDEEVVDIGAPLPGWEIGLLMPPGEIERRWPEAWRAFGMALDDLCAGRLALGAGSGRGGLGVMRGEWTILAPGETHES